jgi:hypothetical protein
LHFTASDRAMPILDKLRLLHGPYQAPALRVGDHADCLLRGTVVVTSWTDARISWPRCRRPEGKSHPSLLLDGELALAVRTEAAAAVRYWWGVSPGVVQRWRRLLGVTRTNNPRTHQLVRQSAQAGAETQQARVWTDAERQARRERSKALDSARHLRPGYQGPWWTAEEMAQLGTMPDAEVAARTGRTIKAVRVKRRKVGIVANGENDRVS